MSRNVVKAVSFLSLMLFLPLPLSAQQQPAPAQEKEAATPPPPATEAKPAEAKPAEVKAEQPAEKKLTVEEELTPQPKLGDRDMSVLSPEADKILRERYMKESNRVMPPVPRETKKAMFDQMLAATPMSMRDLFNFMTAKRKAKKGLKFNEILEAMELKANDMNFKKVGHNKFWKDVSAITGLPTPRVEVLQFCDAMVGRRMLNYSPEFVVFIPCRIAVYEDASGDIWLMTLDWDVSWLARAWHPDSNLPKELVEDAKRIRNAMDAIMNAGANGEW
jgi:uncharacterized protein (DUF302 family)